MPSLTTAWGVTDYGPAETLDRMEMTIPDPGPGEMVIDVEAMALNPLDLKIIAGQMKAFMPVAMPFVPGSDVVGRVVSAGPGVTAFAPGRRVVASTWNGALAQRALLPASAHVVAAPDGADPVELAALPMAGLTALNILRALGDVSGRSLAVLGATGGVGLALLQLASAGGAHVIASATAEDEALVRNNGAAESIDYKAGDFTAEVRRRYPPGVDILVDLVSMFDALLATAGAVRDGGVLVSTLFGPEPPAFGGRIEVVYSRLKAEPDDLASLVERHRAGRLRANVGKTFAFEEGRAACLALRDGHVRGKIVVRVQNG